MKIPVNNTVIYDQPLSFFWFDENGIFHAVFKNVPRTLENVASETQFVQTLLRGNKVCCIADVSACGIIEKEAKEYIKAEIPKMYQALALLSTSPLGRMMSTIIYALTPATVPVKIFDNEPDAKEWLKQYLS